MEKYIYEINKDTGEEVAKLNPEWKEKRDNINYNFLLSQSNIPLDYHELTFENIKDSFQMSKNEFEKCIKYAKNAKDEKLKGVSLYLHSRRKQRSGKTSVSTAIGLEFIKQGLRVNFSIYGDLIDLLRDSLQWENINAKDEIKKYDMCDLIILDDAFDLKTSSTSKSIDRFIRKRMSNNVKFIFTAGFPLTDVANKYSSELYELLDSNCIQLEFKDDIKLVRKSRLEGILD